MDSSALEFMDTVELMDIITRAGLSQLELAFLELRLEGTPMDRISYLLDMPAYKVRSSIQRKIKKYLKTP